MKLERTLTLAILICIGMIVAVVCWLLYSEFQIAHPPNPATFHVEHIVIETPKVKAGGELHYSIPVDKYGVYPANISGTFISEDRRTAYAMKAETGALPQGHYEILNQEVDVPTRVNPGKYTYARIYAYQVGRSTVIRSYETPLFEVVK